MQSQENTAQVPEVEPPSTCLSACLGWLDGKREIGSTMELPEHYEHLMPPPPPPPDRVVDIYGVTWFRHEEAVVSREDLVKKNLTKVDRSLIRKFVPRDVVSKNPPTKDASKISQETDSTQSSNHTPVRFVIKPKRGTSSAARCVTRKISQETDSTESSNHTR